MSDAALRAGLIRLAHSHPEFRKDLLPLITAGCEKLPEGGMRDNCEKKKEEGESKEASKRVATTAIVRKPVTITVRVAQVKALPERASVGGALLTEVRGLMTLDFGGEQPDAIRFTAVIADMGGGWDVRDFQTQRAVSGSGAEILLGVLKSAFEEALEARGDALLGTD